MAKSWKDLDIDAIASDAAKKTDDSLASEISSLTRLKDEEIKQLFPKKEDLAKVVELMKIVSSADSQNKKVNKIVENAEKFAGIIVTLLGKAI